VVVALQWSGRDVPRPADRVLRFLLLFGVALPTALAAGGLLPRFTAAVVWPFVVLLPAALAAVARRVPGGPMTPFTFLGVVGLAFLAVDAIVLGGRALEIPLVGGTIFDGVRFYGLPNALLALVLASTLFVAAPLGPGRGFALLVGVGLVLGAPWVGADLGGAVTMFAAAGLWWPLTTGTEFRWRGVAIAVGTVVVGTAVVLLVNRYLPGAPTHVTRFVEGTGLNPAHVLGRFGDRLSVGFGQVADVPWVLLALAGLVAVLWLAIARAGPVGRGLAAVDGHWRSVLVALTAAGLVAFVANDTGAAAAAPVFLYAVGCVTYPALLAPDAERRSVPGSVGDE
jgi:hypothetical protein